MTLLEAYFKEAWEETGYEPLTNMHIALGATNDTQLLDMLINELVGHIKNVEEPRNYMLFTELVFVINWMSWYYYEAGKQTLSQYFSEKYYEVRDLFYDTYDTNEDACAYFFKVTD